MVPTGWATVPTTLPPSFSIASPRILHGVGAEGDVGPDPVPGLVRAALHQRLRDRRRAGPHVLRPAHGVRRALRAGQRETARARRHEDDVGVARDLVDGERDRGVGNVDDGVDLALVDPSPRDGDARRRASADGRRTMISIFMPATVPPASSTAICAASTEPAPMMSAETLRHVGQDADLAASSPVRRQREAGHRDSRAPRRRARPENSVPSSFLLLPRPPSRRSPASRGRAVCARKRRSRSPANVRCGRNIVPTASRRRP